MKELNGYGGQNEKEVSCKGVTLTLYLDVLFLVNLLVNALMLQTVKLFFHLPSRKRNQLAATCMGAIWGCLSVLLPFGWQWLGILVNGAMVRLAYGRGTKRDLGCWLAGLWLAGMFFGGIFHAADWMMVGAGGNVFGTEKTLPQKPWGLLVFLLAAAGVWLLVQGCFYLIQRKSWERQSIYEVTLSCGSRTKTVAALWDSGNQLYEPYGHQPVHVITDGVCRQLCGHVSQMIYVPFRAVGTGHGILPAFRADGMDVKKGGELIRHYDHPWLAVSSEPLSSKHQYEMLLHGEK